MRAYLLMLTGLTLIALGISLSLFDQTRQAAEPIWLCHNQEHVRNAYISVESGSTTSTTISCPPGWSRPYLSQP